MAKPKEDFTSEVKALVLANPNMLVPHYLIHSYLYYVWDTAVISDTFYEDICKMLLEKWDSIEHRHKPLIDKQALAAGTGYYLKEGDYPGLVVGAACEMIHQHNMRTNAKYEKRYSKAIGKHPRASPRGD